VPASTVICTGDSLGSIGVFDLSGSASVDYPAGAALPLPTGTRPIVPPGPPGLGLLDNVALVPPVPL
jgi:hypothetical protein